MRKRRTRQHIIEDLGFNHIERQVLYAGYTMYRYSTNDYGHDGFIIFFNELGEIESKIVQFQLKSTDVLKTSVDNNLVIFDLSARDLELWLMSEAKVLFIIYDAIQEVAYFIDLQDYFSKNRKSLQKIRKFVRIYIPKDNIFDKQQIINLRQI
jgi:hypothetical protein